MERGLEEGRAWEGKVGCAGRKEQIWEMQKLLNGRTSWKNMMKARGVSGKRGKMSQNYGKRFCGVVCGNSCCSQQWKGFPWCSLWAVPRCCLRLHGFCSRKLCILCQAAISVVFWHLHGCVAGAGSVGLALRCVSSSTCGANKQGARPAVTKQRALGVAGGLPEALTSCYSQNSTFCHLKCYLENTN